MAKTRADILALAKRDYVDVDLDGTVVRLQSLNELESSSLEALWGERWEQTQKVDMRMRRELLVFAIVDDEGKRIFDMADVDTIGELPEWVIDKLYEEADKLRKVGKSAPGTLEKKSEPTAATA